MFNLDDILRQAQGGGAAQSLARQFGISPDQAQAAMEALAPAFQMGFQRQAQNNPQSMGDLLQKMSSGAYANAYGDPAAASRAQGEDVLASLFGSKDGSRAVAQQAAALSGVPGSIIKAMLPVIASMIMGGMFKQASTQGAGGVLGQLGSILAGGGAGGLGSILGGMLGGGGAQQQPSQANMGGGGGLGDILGQVLGGGARQPSPQNMPQGGAGPMGGGLGPLGDILGQILAGGAGMGMPGGAGPQADPRRRMPDPQEEDAGPLGGGGLGGGGLGDILGQMMGQGRAPADQGEAGGELPRGRSRGGVEDEISDMLGGGRAPGGGYARQSESQGQPQGGSLGDILGQMFQTGQQQSQSNMDAWSDIFSQMTGQRRR
jgi:hypothetical protein